MGSSRTAPESRVYTQADVDFLHDNADEYFAKWLDADSRIRAAVEALNDCEQWCTARVTHALAALTAEKEKRCEADAPGWGRCILETGHKSEHITDGAHPFAPRNRR